MAGSPLTGSQVSTTYVSLLKTTDNGAVTGSLKVVTDGLGNDTALKVSSAGIASTGTADVAGALTVPSGSITAIKTSADSQLQIGQDSTHNVNLAWTYNGTPASASAVIGTFGKSNPLTVQGSTLAFDTSSLAFALRGVAAGRIIAGGGGVADDGSSALQTSTFHTTGAASIGGALAVTGNETVGGTLAVTGASTFTGNAAFSGNASITGTVSASNLGTASAQAYSTGTWTPAIGGSATYTLQEGTYTKIGRLVFIGGHLTINAVGSGSVSDISGLPFNATGNAMLSVGYFSGSATGYTYLTGIVSGSAITLRGQTGAGSGMSVANFFGGGTDLWFSAVYEA